MGIVHKNCILVEAVDLSMSFDLRLLNIINDYVLSLDMLLQLNCTAADIFTFLTRELLSAVDRPDMLEQSGLVEGLEPALVALLHHRPVCVALRVLVGLQLLARQEYFIAGVTGELGAVDTFQVECQRFWSVSDETALFARHV